MRVYFSLALRPDLDFNFEAQPVLVLNVLARAKAAELAIYHDAHLRAECLSLLH